MNGLAWLRLRPPALRFAALGAGDAAAVAAIHAKSFARPWSALEFERLLADRIVYADGLFLGGGRAPAGFVLSRLAADEAEIITFALMPKARGRGRGASLLRHHLDLLARLGARSVHLEVEADNAPALAVYRRLAFRQVGRREGYYLLPDGRRAAALTMSIAL